MRAIIAICITIIIGCSISSGTDSDSKIIRWEDLVKDLRNGKNIQLIDKTIESDINLLDAGISQLIGENTYETMITGEITLINCTINGNITTYVKGHYSRFLGSIRLLNCHLNGNINMDNTRIDGSLDFSKSIIHQHASFVGSRVLGNVLFEKCLFAGDLNVSNLHVDGYMNIFDSEIGGVANFQRARLQNTLQASNVQWNGYCDFSQIRVAGNAFFNYGEFNDKVTFNNGKYLDRLEFLDCKFSSEIQDNKICTIIPPLVAGKQEYKPVFIETCNL